jgi:AcrR family transcriptional regulator
VTSPSARPAERRRQADRRAETIQALLDATIDTITALGYHRATAAEICTRAGVSQGALFHHFPSVVDLIVTALGRMTERRVASFVELTGRAAFDEPLDLLRLVSKLAHDPVASVWADVTIAARTDAELRQRVQPAIEARWALIREAASSFRGLADMDERQRDAWLQLMRGVYELAPVFSPFQPADAASRTTDDGRNRALLALVEHLGANFDDRRLH